MIKVKLDHFEETFKDISARKEKCITLFSSEADSTGHYWCPDCQRASPVYDTICKEAQEAGLKFYFFACGERAEWKNPDHVFRKNPKLRIRSVPTMGLFNGDKLVATLVEDEMLNKEQRDLLYE